MKLIKINSFSFVETDDLETINRAELEGFEITEIPKNPLDYDDSLTDIQIQSMINTKEDMSIIRPERISEVKQKEKIIPSEE